MAGREITSRGSGDGEGGRPFRVRIEDGEDIAVASAYLQDAIVPMTELAYQPGDALFVLLAQRFMWERDGAKPERAVERDGEIVGERVHCGLRFDRVKRVRSQGIDRNQRAEMLNLLAIRTRDGHIELAFSGDKTIHLEVDRIDGMAEDIGEPWPTVFRPEHRDDA